MAQTGDGVVIVDQHAAHERLVLERMRRLFDFVATEGGPVSIVFKMLANLLPEYASLSIPLGLMLGIGLVVGGIVVLMYLPIFQLAASI